MLSGTLPWQEELAIIDRTMRAISGITDPEELVDAYWRGIGDLVPIGDFVALSRRNVAPPHYLITRASRFTEHFNPWTQRDRLPRLTGGVLGDIIYANAPVIIEDLPSRLRPDDPAHGYLKGYEAAVALPQYDGGEGLNATCMLFKSAGEIKHQTIPSMHWHAGLFGRGTQNLVLRNQLAEALRSLDRELQVVGEIQRSLLPSSLPDIPGFELAADYLTSARAGGDYYDFFPLDGPARGNWGVFIADVSGHGTPAAVLMAITHAIAHSQPGRHTPPDALLTHLNRQLTRTYTRSGTFVTAFYAVLDPDARTMTYSAAGHNPPRLVRDGRVLSLDGAGSLPLGVVEDQRYGEATVRLEPGDLLVLYTDGITEAMPARGSQAGRANLFGVERLDSVLLACGSIAARDCIDRILAAVQEHTQAAPAGDDRTVITIRCLDRGRV